MVATQLCVSVCVCVCECMSDASRNWCCYALYTLFMMCNMALKCCHYRRLLSRLFNYLLDILSSCSISFQSKRTSGIKLNKFKYSSLTLRFKWNFQCGLINKYCFSVCRQTKRIHNKISIPILIDGFRLSRHFSFLFTVPSFSSVLLLALYRLHFTFRALLKWKSISFSLSTIMQE